MTVRAVEERIVLMCLEQGVRVATAESCTGGLLAFRLTRVPGASGCFPGGVTAYENDVKARVLGVPPDVLRDHGAVSEPVARAMAEGARKLFRADFAVGVTGIAGPSGGTVAKPVGMVYVAVADDRQTQVREYRFTGDRQAIREQSAEAALCLLENYLRERITP
ncbi:MAG TPA: CinA family protein [Candidatus Hydrogenedentes bacterium]|nr:CinA family protein [Candidatus Hydrogenedentota bacterium]HOJ69537.1 CinA family protein [Candidatus Hydrogenedentota bacterium]HOK88923.1 CinA family protein [Candidatus Hydrogenedentota bacterium]HOV60158.1 CinA family protein [Candidatus Hydrogenedentota bacterium]